MFLLSHIRFTSVKELTCMIHFAISFPWAIVFLGYLIRCYELKQELLNWLEFNMTKDWIIFALQQDLKKVVLLYGEIVT